MDREFDLRLKEIRGRISQADPLLVQLVNFASTFSFPIQYGLVLLLDGVTVMGIPAPSASTGKALDDQSVRFFRSMQAIAISSGDDSDQWPEIIDWYRENSPFFTAAKEGDEGRSKLMERLGDHTIEDVTNPLEYPEDLASEAAGVFTPPKAFTLTSARVRPTGGAIWEDVPNMRVNLSAVRAWWTFELNPPEEASETFTRLEKEARDAENPS